jgi:hypothetical protein
MKPSQNKDIGSRSRRSRVLTRRHTLKYVEDLKRGFNAEVGPKDYFEIASYYLYQVESLKLYTARLFSY